jgi:CRP-like cAMP-binding protein
MTGEGYAVASLENEGGICLGLHDHSILMAADRKMNNISELTNLNGPTRNRLLSALPSGELYRFSQKLEEVKLAYGKTIYEAGEVIRDVYFPESGVISLLAAFNGSSTTEVGIIGKEGIVGLPVFLEAKISINRTIVQGAGVALKIGTADFLAECRDSDNLRRILRRFAHLLFSQISQSAACFRFHPIESRLSKWLLMTSDRMESNEIQITQDFLADMLGVRREAVNRAAVDLQKREFINYSRGNLLILNRPNLTKIACVCYGIISNQEQVG